MATQFSPQRGMQTAAILTDADEVVIGGARGPGKASHVGAVVQTPFGERKMGDLKVGSQVSNPDGTVATVIGVYPQGKQQLYRVTFTDGASTLVTAEHLWNARLTCRHPAKADREYYPEGIPVNWKVFTTQQLRFHLKRNEAAVQPSNILVPLTRPVELTGAYANRWDEKRTVDPYALGLLLGDGCLRHGVVGFTSADPQMVQELATRTGFEVRPRASGDYSFGVANNGVLVRKLEELGVYGKLSPEKFIPESYKFANISVRQDVLRGLMDTDGYVDKAGHCSYSSSSLEMARDAQWIARSLGFKATLKTGPSGYKNKSGDYVQCLDSHTVYIQGPNRRELFRLDRKRDLCRDEFNGGVSEAARRIISIEPEAEDDAQCITVDHPNQLYLTDDFIVTHNSFGGILWLTKGEYSAERGSPIYQTALNHPRYTALVLRRQAQDLRDWIDQADEVYRDMGAKLVGNPPKFEWKETGAKIYLDHLNDEAAYNKYRGWNLHRILVEELTEIPHLKWYLRLLGSLRSKRGDDGKVTIQPQILSTTNPDGPGRVWVTKRFVKLYTKGGRAKRWDDERQQFTVQDVAPGLIPPSTLIIDPVTQLSRIFIPALLDENKYLGPEYERMLLAQRGESEATYQAWRFGRWDVFSGQFFDALRLEGPHPDEPAHANHTFDLADTVLADWWPVTIGVDWGFNHEAATYWGRWSQMDKRLYVYREFVTRQMGSRQLGQEIARRTLPDLIGLSDSPHIPLWLSHDAFSKEDNTKTRAELFIEGINDVLGAGSAHIAELTDAEKKMPAAEAYASMEQRYTALQNGPCITVHRARQDRAAMASYVREMLSWQILEKKEPDVNYARQLLASGEHNGRGHELYEEYMARFRNQNQEPVPKVKIERGCTRLRDCLVSLVYDPDKSEVPLKINSTPEGEPGDDPYDGFCHLLMGARFSANRKPRGVFVQERLDKLRSIHGQNPDPAIIHQVLAKASEDWNGQQSDGAWMSLNRLN